MHLITNNCIFILQKNSFYEPQKLYLDLFDYVNAKKIPTFKYASIMIFIIFVYFLVLTVHHMHALKGPSLKNVNVYQVFPHLTLTLHPSMLFLCLRVHEEYVVSVLHFGTFFSGFILDPAL